MLKNQLAAADWLILFRITDRTMEWNNFWRSIPYFIKPRYIFTRNFFNFLHYYYRMIHRYLLVKTLLHCYILDLNTTWENSWPHCAGDRSKPNPNSSGLFDGVTFKKEADDAQEVCNLSILLQLLSAMSLSTPLWLAALAATHTVGFLF